MQYAMVRSDKHVRHHLRTDRAHISDKKFLKFCCWFKLLCLCTPYLVPMSSNLFSSYFRILGEGALGS